MFHLACQGGEDAFHLAMKNSSGTETLGRIREALEAAVSAVSSFVPGAIKVHHTSDRGPVTEADSVVNQVLRQVLVRDGEGWLSEESVDDLQRLEKHRVWVVDPIDGTREFVAGIPEWCVSVGLVENGRAIAGGICNPTTGETFLGSLETGITYNGKRVWTSKKRDLAGAVVLASRTEFERGDWECFQHNHLVIRPVGSVAYKLALVAAGLADATWSLSPKNEWDIAAGVALVEAASGVVRGLANSSLAFNKKSVNFSGFQACGPHLREELTSLIQRHSEVYASAAFISAGSDQKRR
jgi:myo-inositol-1(or 4)-monophosphatase